MKNNRYTLVAKFIIGLVLCAIGVFGMFMSSGPVAFMTGTITMSVGSYMVSWNELLQE